VTDAADERRQESLKTLRNLLKTIDGQKVTLIGDTMLDRYHHGFANNLNSTAPVPVLKITHSEESPGASAHIAIGLTSFGMKVSFYTALGDDSEGESIISTLKEFNISTDNVSIIPSRETLTKIRFFGSRESLLERGQILLQADRGTNEPVDEEIASELKRVVRPLGKLIISFSNRAFWTKSPNVWLEGSDNDRLNYISSVLISQGWSKPKTISEIMSHNRLWGFINRGNDPFFSIIATND